MKRCDKHSRYVAIDECPVCVREERDRLRSIIAEALKNAPVGYIPTHDADHLPQIVADLAESTGKYCALFEDLEEERDRLREELRSDKVEMLRMAANRPVIIGPYNHEIT